MRPLRADYGPASSQDSGNAEGTGFPSLRPVVGRGIFAGARFKEIHP